VVLRGGCQCRLVNWQINGAIRFSAGHESLESTS
jgi:hypothetical protein